MHTDRCGNTSKQKRHTKEVEKTLKHKTLIIIIIIIIIIIQFNSSLLMCQVNSQMATYRNNTAQITTENEYDKNETDTTKQTVIS
jgi:uncharacterized protein YpmB